MRAVRVFVDGPLAANGVARLPAQAAAHVTRVLRLRPGAALTLFDGRGGEFEAELLDSARGGAEVRVGAHRAVERESPLQVALLQGVARGDKMDWIVQKATELGASAVVPLATERSVVQLEAGRAERRAAHWQAVAIAACEQSGRNRLPRIGAPQSLAEACGRDSGPSAPRRWVLVPGAGRPLAAAAAGAGALECELLVGPEGGLSEAELELALRCGFEAVSLGPRILRTETAGAVALALLQAVAGDLRA